MRLPCRNNGWVSVWRNSLPCECGRYVQPCVFPRLRRGLTQPSDFERATSALPAASRLLSSNPAPVSPSYIRFSGLSWRGWRTVEMRLPGGETWNPPRDVRAEGVVLDAKARLQNRLFVSQHENV